MLSLGFSYPAAPRLGLFSAAKFSARCRPPPAAGEMDEHVFFVPEPVDEVVPVPAGMESPINDELSDHYSLVSEYINNALAIVNDQYYTGFYGVPVAQMPQMAELILSIDNVAELVIPLIEEAGNNAFLIPPQHFMALQFLGIIWPMGEVQGSVLDQQVQGSVLDQQVQGGPPPPQVVQDGPPPPRLPPVQPHSPRRPEPPLRIRRRHGRPKVPKDAPPEDAPHREVHTCLLTVVVVVTAAIVAACILWYL